MRKAASTHLTAKYPLMHSSTNHLNGAASTFPPITINISSVNLMSGSKPKFPPGELSNINPKSEIKNSHQIYHILNNFRVSIKKFQYSNLSLQHNYVIILLKTDKCKSSIKNLNYKINYTTYTTIYASTVANSKVNHISWMIKIYFHGSFQ